MALLNCGYCSFFFILFSTSFVLPFITSLPVPENDSPYDKFIDFLSENNCTMPKEIKLPFPESSDPSPFSYLSTPLNECRTTDALKENDEAYLLCAEIFDVLQNVICFGSSQSLPTIDSHLSENICPDFNTMRNIFPKRNDYLSGKLVDSVICKIMCTQEKYKLLCQTLLWSYDTQSKMTNALENEDKGTEKEIINEAFPGKGLAPIKVNLVSKSESKDQGHNKETDKLISTGSTPTKSQNSLDGTNLKNLESSDKKISSEVTSQMNLTKAHSLTSEIPAVSLPKTVKITAQPLNESITANQKLSPEFDDNENTKSVKSGNLSNPKVQNTPITKNKNEINVDEQPEKVIVENVEKSSSANGGNVEKNSDTNENAGKSSDLNVEKSSSPNGDVEKSSGANGNDLSSINNNIKGNEGVKNISDSILQNENNVNSNIDTKASEKSETVSIPNTEMDNELNNGSLQDQENEAKPTPTDVKIPDDKDTNVEKPKLTDFENEVPPDIDSKLSESSTVQINPDEEGEQHQDDKEQEQYNDTENEGDYAKADYDNSLNLPPKSREPDVIKTSIVAGGSSQLSNNYESYMNQRTNIGRVPDVVPNFPDQENGNFFFYFLSIVFILMAGYLIFHNKQKIIALIVEGRHERRRRSHGAGYKKLETK